MIGFKKVLRFPKRSRRQGRRTEPWNNLHRRSMQGMYLDIYSSFLSACSRALARIFLWFFKSIRYSTEVRTYDLIHARHNRQAAAMRPPARRWPGVTGELEPESYQRSSQTIVSMAPPTTMMVMTVKSSSPCRDIFIGLVLGLVIGGVQMRAVCKRVSRALHRVRVQVRSNV
jgi:hypothetical protein